MKRVLLAGLTFLLVLLILAACAPQKAQPAPAPAPPTAASAAPAVPQVAPVKPAWEEEWERTVAAAKKEGSVVIYTSIGGESRVVLVKAFKDRFGISAEWVTARAASITEKLLTERRAGLYLADIYMGGSTTITNTVKPGGVLEPLEPALILPELLDPKTWRAGVLPFFDKDRMGLAMASVATPSLAVNTNLVKPGEIKSFRDLLDPKWKGKILMNDPTTTGAGLKWFGVMVEKAGLDYMRQLAKQEPAILRDERQQVEWLAHGKYPILISPKADATAEFIKAGAPVQRVVTTDGMHIGAGAAYLTRLNKPAHPNAQKVFINWILTKEGQTLLSQARLSPSSRADISTEGLDPSRVPQPGVQYFNGDAEDFVRREPEFSKAAQEIFGAFVK